jgi:P4 family phage/plasmid primase-like protien
MTQSDSESPLGDAAPRSAVLASFHGPPPDQGESWDAGSRLKLDDNDLGNAHRLASELKGDLIRVAGRGWAVFDGKRYSFENGAEPALEKATILPRLIEDEVAALDTVPLTVSAINEAMATSGETDREVVERRLKVARRKGKAAFAKQCGNLARIRAALELTGPNFLTKLDRLDADRTLLQCDNGTLDLRAIADVPDAEDPEEKLLRWHAALRPHARQGLPTRLADVAFDPEARPPEFERLVSLAMPTEEGRAYLQRVFGMMLGGRQTEAAIVLLGQGGNGKSTLVRCLAAVMGDYTQPCRIEMFTEIRGGGGLGPTPEEAVLPGARVLVAAEPRPGVTLDAGKIKGLTGGDPRQANPKNKDVFSYTPVGVPILQANRMPNINDPSEGFWRRIYPVRFMVKLHELPREEQRTDAEIDAMIRDERPGMLNWLLEGYVAFRDMGLSPPPDALSLKRSLRTLADPVGQFLADKTAIRTGARIRTGALHSAFNTWAEAEGVKATSPRGFAGALLALDFVREKSTGGHYYWLGIEITDTSLLDQGGGA